MSRRRRRPRFPFIPLGIVISVVAVVATGGWAIVLPVMIGAIVLSVIQRGVGGGGGADYDSNDNDSGGGFWDFFSGGDSSDSGSSDSGSSGCGGGCGGGGD